MRRLLALSGALLALCVVAGPVSADAAYHTERLTLDPIGGAPGSGMVVNTHPNGPEVYAHEIDTLNGTLPDTDYVVRLWVYPFDTDCSEAGVNFASTSVRTNPAGHGHGQLFISPDQVPEALRGNQMHGVRWDVTLDGVPQYQTRCTVVTLD